MFSGRLAVAVLTLATCASLAACSDEEPEQEEPASATDLGVRRDLPLDDSCQWLTADEAGARLEQAGGPVGPERVTAIESAQFQDASAPDDISDCYYSLGDQKGMLVVTLIPSREAASNWRKHMEEIADKGPQESERATGVSEDTLTRVADAPTFQRANRGEHDLGCELFALTGDAAVVGLSVSVRGATDGSAVCAAARAALETVIGNLPEDSSI